MNPTLRVLLAGAAGLVVGMSCSVTFKDDVVYSCTTTADCGGDGFVCTAPEGGAGTCCKPGGDVELCGDGIDNDCDGLLDSADTFPAETCNGIDDDCDQQTDEGFDLRADPLNCGTCGTACDAATQMCSNGSCVLRGETDCSDGVDNDANTKTDCDDLACNLQPCGAGCQCQGLKKAERSCTDGADNDGDGDVDCADADCINIACGTGCICENGVKRETDCADTMDNDGDGMNDCDDSQCGGQICAGGTTRRCAGPTCLCNDGGVVPETAGLCADGVDNDCDNLLDCQEAGCDGVSCVADGGVAPDGGASCLCTGGRKAEQHCADRRDNDGDGFTDCADNVDCPAGIACTALVGTAIRTGNCGAARLCEVELCTDNMDNDSDQQVDCADSDCDALACSTGGTTPDGGPSCRCVAGIKVETNCLDRADNDGDTQIDCADMDCNLAACGTGTAPDAGPSCRCVGSAATEANCRDRLDNDGDSLTDCMDPNCPTGIACTRTNGSPGTCQSNGNCN